MGLIFSKESKQKKNYRQACSSAAMTSARSWPQGLSEYQDSLERLAYSSMLEEWRGVVDARLPSMPLWEAHRVNVSERESACVYVRVYMYMYM